MSAPSKEKSRRKFLFQLASASATFAFANAAVYTIGSAFKKLDGSIVAGAKCGASGSNSFTGGGADDTLCSSLGGASGTAPNAWCCSGTDSSDYGPTDTMGGGGCTRTCN